MQIIELSRFPKLKPVDSPPRMFTLNGCGTAVYGARDRDPETGTYVKTYCICILFVPIFALRAYRVLKADQGWYFLGREPLSLPARFWNRAVIGGLACSVVLAGWNAHFSSPNYRAAQHLKKAKELVAAGNLAEAAAIERSVLVGVSGRTDEARAALLALLDGPVHQADARQTEGVFRVAASLPLEWGVPPIVPNLLERGLIEVDRLAAADPCGALRVLDAISPLGENDARLSDRREPLLEEAVVREPQNADFASDLAVIYETRGEVDKCVEVLGPHKEHLAGREGARILGQVLAHRGDVEASFRLLAPYTEKRLERLHVAEEAYEQALRTAERGLVDELNQNRGPTTFYQKYEAASSEDDKHALLAEYIAAAVRDDPRIQVKQQELVAAAEIVPAALDLGIVRLRRAQGMGEGEGRRRELEAAEQTFLAIRGVASESDTYRLFLGQVDYWLGKHAEGRKLLDEFMASKERNFDSLFAAAGILREVGASDEARTLIEEAYEKEDDRAKRFQAASLRAVTSIDEEDRIKWLGLSDPAQPRIKALLHTATGRRLMAKGGNDGAATEFRLAITAYKGLVQDSTILNDIGLVYLSLFGVTGEREHYDQALEALDKAVALSPGDSILLFNNAVALLDGAIAEVIGDRLDLGRLREAGHLGLCSYLYSDDAGREPFREQLRAHPGVKRSLDYFDKVLVLAPKNAAAYLQAAGVHRYLRNLEALRDLHSRLESVEQITQGSQERTLDYYAGKDDAKYRAENLAQQSTLNVLVEELRQRPRDATFAVAVAGLVATQITAGMFGSPSDGNGLVALAEEAHQAAPSAGTRDLLKVALMHRAHQRLYATFAGYARMADRAARSMTSFNLVVLALGGSDEAARAALADPDVQRTAALLVEDLHAFPDSPGISDWAILRVTHPQEAASCAEVLKKDQVGRLYDEITRTLSPMSAETAFNGYWTALLEGDEPRGREILKQCAKRGVPMPFDVD